MPYCGSLNAVFFFFLPNLAASQPYRDICNQEAAVAILHAVWWLPKEKSKFYCNRSIFVTSINDRPGTFGGRAVPVQLQEGSSVIFD